MIDDASEIAAWLRLLETPQVGRATTRRLLARFGSAQAVFDARPSDWREVASADACAALAAAPPEFERLLADTLAWLAASAAAPRAVVTIGDPRYPPCLLETADPPLLLYVQGRRPELLMANSLAIVGSRHPTPQGLDNARAIARELSQTGMAIVSGLAAGIDAAAHEGGLDGGASTLAVVGTGIDRVYPGRHRELAHRIEANGLIVSEFALGRPPLPAHFPQRNRIIAGLSRGTLVVEAALQSGSLITARHALEAGREVMAMPGSVHSPLSQGCHWLIKQGAQLVESAADVIEALGGLAPAMRSPAGSPAPAEPSPADPLLDALGYEPMSLDELMARTGWPPQHLSARLLDLELAGRVARLPGQLFQRVGRG